MIIGYSDPYISHPGDSIQIMVSSTVGSYTAEVVRLIHGDLDERGPGLRYEGVSGALPSGAAYEGREQSIAPGSLVQVDDGPFGSLPSFSIQMLIWPTLLSGGTQALAACWDDSVGAGFGLFLNRDGETELRLGNGEGEVASTASGIPVLLRRWYAVAASYDAETGVVTVVQDPLRSWPTAQRPTTVRQRITIDRAFTDGAPFGIAGMLDRRLAPIHCYNGKIERPIVLDRALDAQGLRELATATLPGASLPDGTVAAWDFAMGNSPMEATDCGPNGLHGRVLNGPTRAVTSSRWTGREMNFRQCPEQYAAMHFHDDDLDDAGWEADFTVRLPEDAQGGAYAVHVTAGDLDDWITFLVANASPRSEVALLLPSFSHLAYSNEHLVHDDARAARSGITHEHYVQHGTPYEQRMFEYIAANRLHSTYDRHSDGSGVSLASWRRPLANVRPSYNKPSQQFAIPHQLGADLYTVDWMEAQGIKYDVITDHDLHYRGAEALAPYRVIVTGTHPEYCSEAMLDGFEGYLDNGGRVMYLGGQGFYWVTPVDPVRPHVIEVRRGESGTRTWNALPGENYCATTGEPGGMWRSRGKTPQRLFGTGFTAQGTDAGRPYERIASKSSRDLAFVFDGVDEELIGDFGIYLEAAGGWEIDRIDYDLGTPNHTVLLATATGFSDTYQHVIEEVLDGTNPNEGGTQNPLVRSDLAYVAYPKGGAVFSASSITWAGSLAHNGYDNSISRITLNVLRHFSTHTEQGV